MYISIYYLAIATLVDKYCFGVFFQVESAWLVLRKKSHPCILLRHPISSLIDLGEERQSTGKGSP